MFQNAILLPSYLGPELIAVSIPAILRSLRADSKLFVLLNKADKDSIDICRDNKVEFFATETNLGTSGLDVFIPYLNCEYVTHINSDMIPSIGWDKNLINIVKSENCSASAQLVEPYGTGNPLVIIDNLGDFSVELENRFQSKFLNGAYNRGSVIGYNHPIMVKKSDYLKVGGYSNNFDSRFIPLAYALDDFYAYRLWMLYNKEFRHISSGRDFVYHCISATNNKIDKGYRDANNGMNHFESSSGMNLQTFRNWINAFSGVETK